MGAAGSARARESAPRVAIRCARTAKPRGTRARCARSCPRRSSCAGAKAATRASALAAASSSNGAPAATTWSAAAATRSAGSAWGLGPRGARARSLASSARSRRARASPSSGSVPSPLTPHGAAARLRAPARLRVTLGALRGDERVVPVQPRPIQRCRHLGAAHLRAVPLAGDGASRRARQLEHGALVDVHAQILLPAGSAEGVAARVARCPGRSEADQAPWEQRVCSSGGGGGGGSR